MDWSQIWQMLIPIIVLGLGQLTIWLKSQQATTHAQNAANHGALNNAAIQQLNERLNATEPRVMKR